ncbi:signal peptidase I [Flavobacteriaceae bacterium S0825]|uniref:signal peptidase I n=1 Tax=Gaetbulibacter sp. S0825 TaxID=2720084 RepID=UPI0014315A84|nr:signal peptidase I [Gaetbulibacter sp. S0825]MCK0108900.1 signal peptidase I [Flavobacteriaceae bacterium S0825]NIX64536.1 signal peptidase I [Gaetbulibacter sp. S0825]
MKKKTFRIILIGILVLFGVLRFFGALRFFNVPSTSNEPNLSLNSRFIGSNLVKPKALDFTYFKFSDSLHGSAYIKRLIALPGDKLECRNGSFFVNDQNIDDSLNLRYSYKISKEFYDDYIKESFEKDESFLAYPISNDSILTFLDDSFVSELPVKIERFNEVESEGVSTDISSKTSNWNINNFGPIVMPKNKYFFLGDNRDNSLDSRYRGFVEEENILGTLIFKF